MVETQLNTRSLHPIFGEEIVGISIKDQLDPSLAERIRSVLNRAGVVLIRGQVLSDEDLLALCALMGEKWGQRLKAKVGTYSGDGVFPVSNVDKAGKILPADDKTRALNVANEFWHTDGTYGRPRADVSFLYSRVVPPKGGETEYCDTRHAYDLLPPQMREKVSGLFAHHSITHSRTLTGFKLEDWDPETLKTFLPVKRPMVHVHRGSGRKALCIASHVENIDDYTYEESQNMVRELIEVATGPGCVYSHRWQVGDLLLWDNACTMHRARPYEDFAHIRQLIGTRTVDSLDG